MKDYSGFITACIFIFVICFFCIGIIVSFWSKKNTKGRNGIIKTGLIRYLNTIDNKENIGISESEFNKFFKDVFTNPNRSEKRWCVIEIDFLKAYRKQYGDDGLHSLLVNLNIQCSRKTQMYINNFMKEYAKATKKT